jgi:hypothetical protein
VSDTSAVSLDLTILARELATWAKRDDSKAQPEVREAANTAMRSIDRMLGELHRLRAQLMDEIRDSDDAAAARVDALLAQRPSADQIAERAMDVIDRAVADGRRPG